jgi:hypothetical protein
VTTRQTAATIVLVILALFAARDFAKLNGDLPWRTMYDFRVFYSAGQVVADHDDPYQVEPLRTFEHRLHQGGLWNDPTYAIPAPLPPYDFPPFAALSVLPYSYAKILVAVLIAAAVVVTAFALARLGIPPLAAFAALLLSDGLQGMHLGQIYPFVVMLIALGGVALRNGRATLAGVLVGLTLIEPQIGLAICIVAFALLPRARLALAIAVVAFVVIGLATAGIHGSIEWIAQIIPAQARSEAAFWGQYSLTSVLVAAGVSRNVALATGSIVYILGIVASIFFARRLTQRSDRPEYVLFVPAAIAVTGATYVHLVAIPAAIPLALSLTQTTSLAARWRFVIPLVLLSIPWLMVQALKPLFFASLLVAVAIFIGFRIPTRQAIALSCVTGLGLWLLALHTPPPLQALDSEPPITADVALAVGHTPAMAFDRAREIAKLPTWLGLLSLFGAMLARAYGR